MKFTQVEKGTVALIQQQPDGTIKQVGLTKDQSVLLQAFLSAMSTESELVLMPKEFDLELKAK